MKDKTIRILTLIGMWIGIVLFLLAIIALSKNIKEIKTDPIIYGMEKHEFSSCTCYTPDGKFTEILLENYVTNPG